jgi:hypothetical protein
MTEFDKAGYYPAFLLDSSVMGITSKKGKGVFLFVYVKI